jgi:hypothetical protein
MAYGPDNDCQLDVTKTTSVAVSPGYGAFVRFSCPTAVERAVCIYRADQGAVKLAERRFAFEPWNSGRNEGDGSVVYIITAWRKKQQPGEGPAWRQITVCSMLGSRHEAGPACPTAEAPGAEDVVAVSVDLTPQSAEQP